jgi:periplasmic copper chaperone A
MKLLKTIGFAALIAGMSALSAFAHGYKVGNLEIQHPHSPATLPGAPVGAGFLTIVNTGKDDDRLISVTTPIAGEGQIHEMAMEGEVMKMRQLKDGIPIPAGATVELKRGGLHLMFMPLKQPMKEGEMVKATLTFEKAGSVDVEFKVEAANGSAMDHGTDEGHDAHKGHTK